MINKLNEHYSFTTPASVHDEEALTALELAGRTAAKVNEIVDDQNKLRQETEQTLDDFENDTIPEEVKSQFDKNLSDGTFDQSISKYLGNLEERVDNLVENLAEGSTTMDAEVIDVRVDEYGTTYDSAGASVRGQVRDANYKMHSSPYKAAGTSISMTVNPNTGTVSLNFKGQLAMKTKQGVQSRIWSDLITDIADNCHYSTAQPNNMVIDVAAHTVLLYNLATSKLRLVYTGSHINSIRNNDLILFHNAWGEPMGGALLDIITRDRVAACEAKFGTMPRHDVQAGAMYISQSGTCTVLGKDDTGAVQLTFSKPLVARIGNLQEGLPWTDIVEHVPNTVSGDSCTVTIQAYNALVFNVTEEKLRVRSAVDKILPDDFILIQASYANVIGGYLMPQMTKADVSELAKRVTTLETKAEVTNEILEVAEFNKKFRAATGKVESFIFFTDPHLCEGDNWKEKLHNYMAKVKQAFDETPCSVVIGGGDWIGNGDTKAEACDKLSYVAGYMRKLFGDKYIPVVGNHDTNYQGIAYEGAEANSGQLTPQQLANMWDAERTSGLRTYDVGDVRFIVLDTQTDWDVTENEYMAAQLMFLNGGIKNNATNVIVAHMYETTEDTENPFMTLVSRLLGAINNRTYVSINYFGVDVSVNGGAYLNTTTSIAVLLCGHLHKDKKIVRTPTVITTTHMQDGGTPTFDLCMLDLDRKRFETVRVGAGENRYSLYKTADEGSNNVEIAFCGVLNDEYFVSEGMDEETKNAFIASLKNSSKSMRVKLNAPPVDANDFDFCSTATGLMSREGVEYTVPVSFSNVTRVYQWMVGGLEILGVPDWTSPDPVWSDSKEGGAPYSTALVYNSYGEVE